jgi:hypothetical protein
MKKMFKMMVALTLLFALVPLSAYAGTITPGTAQDVTAYSASQYRPDTTLRLTHSGVAPTAGIAAVRKNASNQPMVPFGSVVTIPAWVYADGYLTDHFTIKDTGVASTQTQYAIDLWFGFCRTNAYTGTGATALNCQTTDTKFVNAINFGEEHWMISFTTP